MKLDLSLTSFSRYGSYLSIHYDIWDAQNSDVLYLRTHHARPLKPRHVFRLDVLQGDQAVDTAANAEPAELTMRPASGGQGRVTACMPDTRTVRFRGEGLGLRLLAPRVSARVAHPTDDGRWVVLHANGQRRYVVQCLRGRLQPDAPWRVDQRNRSGCERIVFQLQPDGDGRMEAAVTEASTALPAPEARPYDEGLGQVRAEYRDWLSRVPAAAEGGEEGWELAAYLLWASTVEPCGRLTRPAVYMNKAHMDQVWSWDHCFNAMALSYRHPELAWDQLMLFADVQDEGGMMPDSINDAFARWNFGKPPVHGWALRFCMQRSPGFFTSDRLRQAYDWLAAWSRRWRMQRVWAGDTLPYYVHGNDSGWDNATLFDEGTPLVAPDLAAHLCYQMDVVAELGERLGKDQEARQWRRASDEMLDALVDRLWRGDRFVGLRKPDGKEIYCDSLITCLPIVLGGRLPGQVRAALVQRIRRHLTEHGLATEAPDSPRYYQDSHAYWRGPVWAPAVMLVVSGLADIGEHELARTISGRFCRAAARCRFRENFDAITGEGCSDIAYTWTASVFLVLAAEYV